ncbi:hypothetical protein EQG63_10620 [Flavobacterium amnicola]|uniref:DUF6265 domain-containing protein n=1 Tax=Flavobacterium amnicola TaxID=2506422 RepID=A0A4Q1K096_9FLAO|nr:DUF6265 family protein [Flavobacterium amnicola]RXR17237.1 hypothetical protein EQG63_10620 [Flavobacterium amnicola]
MKNYILLFASLLLFSCGEKKEAKKFPLIEKANWFLGEWENQSKMGDFTENWEKLSDSTFMGISIVKQGKDTVFHENVVLEQKNDSLFYNVAIKGNTEEVTSFYLTSFTDKQLVFENPKHDYPTKIIYNLISPDSISASIHGKVKGVEQSETYPMQKKK